MKAWTTAGVALALMFFSASFVHAQIDGVVTLKDALKTTLQANGAKSLKKKVYTLDETRRTEFSVRYGIAGVSKVTMFTGLDAEKQAVGVVVIVDVQGKEGPLQMVVALDPENGAVENLGFTVFGEEKGKPAARAVYLKQFLGADASRELKLGKDIDGVTGATSTSSAVARGVRLALTLYDYLVINATQGAGK